MAFSLALYTPSSSSSTHRRLLSPLSSLPLLLFLSDQSVLGVERCFEEPLAEQEEEDKEEPSVIDIHVYNTGRACGIGVVVIRSRVLNVTQV